MRTIFQDLRYAVRQLAKAPGFAAVAIITLALGIGANTAIFSVVNAVLLNPLPYPQPDRIMVLFHDKPNFRTGSISYLNFDDWRRENQSFSSMAAYREMGGVTLSSSGEPESVMGQMVSAGFFEILGIKPVLGRTFTADEDRLGANPTVMIGEGLWKRKFASDPRVVGKTVILDGQGRTIIGIVPASFRLKMWNFQRSDIFVPIGEFSQPAFRNRNAAWGTDAIARLKPGVSVNDAAQYLAHVNLGLAAAYPDEDANIKTRIVPLKDVIVGEVRPALLVLLGAVVFVLLIACVNVSNLMLARSTARSREFAVRIALGAGQRRLVRQLLTESIALALIGGGLGLLLAHWGTQVALTFLPQALPRADSVRLDGRVLLFTLLASGLSGIVFGMVPAFKTSHTHVSTTLNEFGRSVATTRSRAQSAFVVVEVAMALVLLVGAGLMVRTLMRLWSLSPGFNAHNVLSFVVSMPPSLAKENPDGIRAAYRQLHQTLATIPGVESLSLEWGSHPMKGDTEESFYLEGEPRPAHLADLPYTLLYMVEPAYLQVMQVPLLRGRFLTDADNEKASPVVVIDEDFAARYFAGRDPLGKHIYRVDPISGEAQADEIVGVVGHVRQWGLADDSTETMHAQVYQPLTQASDRRMGLIALGSHVYLRTKPGVDPTAVFPTIRNRVAQFNGETVAFEPEAMETVVADSISRQRFTMILFTGFAAVALLLASVGIYGVLSYIVGQRAKEIGVRMALGAQRGDVMRAVLGDGARMTLIGIIVGGMVAVALTRLMSSILFEVKPTDPLTFGGVALLLCAIALFACYIPARRAASLDPMRALRSE
jgi:putative ABC transport system permease protein